MSERLAGFNRDDLRARLEELARRAEESAAAHLAFEQPGWASFFNGVAGGYRARLDALARDDARRAQRKRT